MSQQLPASANGLVGLKPSRGRMPSDSLLASPLGVEGALTRSVRDTALLLDLTCGALTGPAFITPPPARPYVHEVGVDPGMLRVGVCTTMPNGQEVHHDCAAVTSDAAVMLEKLGHHVEAASPTFLQDALVSAMQHLLGAPTAVDIDRRLATLGRELRDNDVENLTRAVYQRCKSQSAADLALAYSAVERTAHHIGEFFDDYDLLLTPTLGMPTPSLGLLDPMSVEAIWNHAGVYGAMTGPFNSGGQPAISLPLGKDSTGLPLGVQLVAATGREDLLIRVASQLESAHPWSIVPTAPVTTSV
ncbi:hypothetical protein JO861_19245 [Rhodococcus hoagii]|uniref:amidase n=1 Tax=Rhodococcus hoagii TaxID=43767 RepID=UPI0019661D76|nr:amidase family protein [Prescottella equi]MBM9838687.1 hypothetical protein [Prescottella equi]